MIDEHDIEDELGKLRGEARYRHENWGGEGYRGHRELRGFIHALEWVLDPESDRTHPPSGWKTIRPRYENPDVWETGHD